MELTGVPAVIQRIACKVDISNVNSGFFDTRMKILIPSRPVVPVTNMRYEELQHDLAIELGTFPKLIEY